MPKNMLKKLLLSFTIFLFSSYAVSSERLAIVTSDWATAETLSMLGVTPIAITQLRGYQIWTGNETPLGDAIDIGLKPMPNLELVADYNPTFIFGDNSILLQHISEMAPTSNISLYPFKENPWESIINFIFDIAEQLDLLQEAERVTAQASQKIAILREKIEDKETPVLIAQFRDDRHAWVYGENSLLQAVIDELGLTNAWDQPTSDIGISLVSIDQLARSGGHLFIIESPAFQATIRNRLENSGIWRVLISQREGKITYLPAKYWPIGALPSALRFADSLTTALTNSDGGS